ncbi:hypothetical protein Lrub_0101 [Legionella rubrilucens]|uniref:Uncharacterized protein n=1 Tax=Legionella rubrilucens TaxID=458 RepID=A0A0W0Y6J1_9GAMM|nr:STY0301 family protein [Legionella rubrilucens]KTD52469.1 hypothetical protein Lrub_0101 [Legionella rubrilucens]
MNKIRPVSLLITIVLLVQHPVFAEQGISPVSRVNSISPACLPTIDVTQALKKTYQGWDAFVPAATYFLDGISFYSGKPDELALLKPDINNSRRAKWTFSPKDAVYMLCEYNQTIIALTKKLPPNLTDCEVTYQNQVMGSKGPLPGRVICHTA